MSRLGSITSLLKGVRKIDWLVVLAALSVLLLIFVKNDGQDVNVYEGTELEIRLSRVLESVDGVGRVKVMINEKQSAVQAFSGGAGEQEITGIVIVAEGAKDLRVALALQQAAKTLLNVELSQIQVLEMNEGG